MLVTVGYGWLAVKRAELSALGIRQKVSPFSYQRGDTVYLEEDCGMALFHKAKGFTDCSHYANKYSERSPIRSYDDFSLRRVTRIAIQNRKVLQLSRFLL